MITNEHQSDMKMTSHMIAYLLNQVNFFYGNIKDLVSKELMKLVIIIDEVDGVERAAVFLGYVDTLKPNINYVSNLLNFYGN